MRCFVLVLLLATSSSTKLSAQHGIAYTVAFDELIDRLDLEMNLPVERWLKLQPILGDEYLDYQLVVRDDSLEFRVLVLEDPIQAIYPHIEFQRTLTHVASNGVMDSIHIEQHITSRPQPYDWSVRAAFRPKEDFSTMSQARLWAQYKENKALVLIIALYDNPAHWDDRYFDFLKFAEHGKY